MQLSRRSVAYAKALVSDPLANWPFTAVARTVFGNTAGVRQNLYGEAQRIYCSLLSGKSKRATASDEIGMKVQELRRNGILLLDGHCNAKLVERLRERLNELVEPVSEFAEAVTSEKILQLCPEVLDVVDNKIASILHTYYGAYIHVDDVLYRVHRSVPKEVAENEEVFSNFWHCDSSPTSEIALLVVLSDTDLSCGPTHAIAKQPTKSVVRRTYRQRHTFAASEIEAKNGHKIHRMVGKAGTLMLVETTKCLHKAGVPAQGKNREWLAFRIFPTADRACDRKFYKDPVYRFTHPKKRG